MALFKRLDALKGEEPELDLDELEKEFEPILIDGEKIQQVCKTVRDMYVFTDRRLILVARQGNERPDRTQGSAKVEYLTIPFRSITHFAVETAGTFDQDAELKIWLSGLAEPLVKEFKAGTDIIAIQKLLATLILRKTSRI